MTATKPSVRRRSDLQFPLVHMTAMSEQSWRFTTCCGAASARLAGTLSLVFFTAEYSLLSGVGADPIGAHALKTPKPKGGHSYPPVDIMFVTIMLR
jgi:hypothetical protein